MKKKLSVILLLFTLISMANEKATVYIYRTKALDKKSAPIFIDDYHVVDLYSESFIKIELEPGLHYISSGFKLKRKGFAMTLQENLVAGKTYYFTVALNKLKPLSKITEKDAKTLSNLKTKITIEQKLFKMVEGSNGFDKILHSSKNKLGKYVMDKIVDNRSEQTPNPFLNVSSSIANNSKTTSPTKISNTIEASYTGSLSGVNQNTNLVASAINIQKSAPKENIKKVNTSLNNSDISVEEIYENYLKLIDPNNSFLKMNSLTRIEQVESVIKTNGTNLNSNYVMLNLRNIKGQIISVMKVPNMTTKTVFDGVSGYTELSNGFKNNINDDLIKLFKQGNNNLLLLEQKVPENAIVKQTTFEGTNTYAVIYKYQDNEMQDYYDVNDFKKIASTSKSVINGINSTTTIIYENYKDFDGILQPSSQKTQVISTGNNINSKINSVASITYKYNENFDEYANKSLKTIAANIAAIPLGTSNTFDTTASKTSTNHSQSLSESLANIENLTDSEIFNQLNKREQLYQLLLKNNKNSEHHSTNTYAVNNLATVESVGEIERINRMESANAGKIKYRRSSLYTLMLDDNTREHYNIIKDAFGNTILSEKFNNHNIGPYLIPAHNISGEKDQTQLIEDYLNTNNVAKNLVAKWFNRNEKGHFNMNLIAERGQYNASEIDIKIAKSSIRGKALLSDAGKELIGNTFVVVYDYKYTNKAEQAKKRKGFLNVVKSIASVVPGGDDVLNVASVAELGSDVVGKGYFVRTSSYLYRLIWNDAIAQDFYENLWIDENDSDIAKKEAFDKTNLFRLEYVGSEVSRNNLQSTIFSSKSNGQLIEIATTKAVDKNIGKLQRSYEEFRVKTPLLSIDPIAAKIGLKEDIEKNDKFEVLEQVLNEDGTTSYKRVGIIKADSIWDNTYLADEINKSSKNNYTTFKGNNKKLAPGMLIRQIN